MTWSEHHRRAPLWGWHPAGIVEIHPELPLLAPELAQLREQAITVTRVTVVDHVQNTITDHVMLGDLPWTDHA